MSRRRKNGVQKQKSNGNRINILRLLTILVAFICFGYSIRQYNHFAIVEFRYLMMVFLIPGFLFGILMYRYEKKIDENAFKAYDHFIWSILTYGSISCSVFFMSNEYLSINKAYNQDFLILEKHKEYRRSPNYIVVKIEGAERDINIHDYSYAEIAMAKAAEIKLKKGFFGFYLLMETKLKY